MFILDIIFLGFVALAVYGAVVKIRSFTRRGKKVDDKELNTRWREVQNSIIHQDKVVEEWSGTFNGAGGQSVQLMENITRRVRSDDIPDAVVSKRQIAIVGEQKKREFVVVSNAGELLKPYEILINASDYGSRMNVLWYVVLDKHAKFDKFVDGGMRADEEYKTTMGEQRALSIFVSVVRSLFDDELKQMMDGLKLDFTKEDSTTRGFGNLS